VRSISATHSTHQGSVLVPPRLTRPRSHSLATANFSHHSHSFASLSPLLRCTNTHLI
jgi:hypothetical protein